MPFSIALLLMSVLAACTSARQFRRFFVTACPAEGPTTESELRLHLEPVSMPVYYDALAVVKHALRLGTLAMYAERQGVGTLTTETPWSVTDLDARIAADVVAVRATGAIITANEVEASFARELDLTETALRRWVQQAQVDAGRGRTGALTTAEREEIALDIRLRFGANMPSEYAPMASPLRAHACFVSACTRDGVWSCSARTASE